MKIVLSSFTAVMLFMLASMVTAADLPDFTELVEKSSPAVVNIRTTRKAGSGGVPYGHPQIDQIPEFFRHFFGDQLPRRGQPEAQSMGSGFIVSEDGYILTNNHVVAGADEIFIRLADRRQLTAQLIGADAKSDLAVLKVEAEDLPTLKMGTSSDLKVGEWVLAIGSPFGFDYSVTAGIVSAIGRSLPNENYVPFIQTDVAINPGNSGGPLFNLDGEVIGINSQIFTRSGGFMGLSFAIPIDVALNVADQLKTSGIVKRGWLGVLIQEVSKDLADSFELDKPQGALVAQVMSGSPADKAGLQPGDVIVELDGEDIGLSSELPHMVGKLKPGTKVELDVVRQGKKKSIDVVLGQLPGDDEVIAAVPASVASKGKLNIEVRNLSDQEREELRVAGGVLVTEVKQGPGASAGIRVGDIINSINNEPVNSVSAYNDRVEELPRNKSIPVLIVRNGNPAFIVVRIDDD